MKITLFCLGLTAIFSGCAHPQSKQPPRIPAGIVEGKVRDIGFDGLCGPKPFISLGTAHVTIVEPESLRGRDLVVSSSEDYPFKIGDDVEFDFTGVGIDVNADGTFGTLMLYHLPLKVRPKPPLQTPTSGTPAPGAPVAPPDGAADR
jgi:hypothetical protein